MTRRRDLIPTHIQERRIERAKQRRVRRGRERLAWQYYDECLAAGRAGDEAGAAEGLIGMSRALKNHPRWGAEAREVLKTFGIHVWVRGMSEGVHDG